MVTFHRLAVTGLLILTAALAVAAARPDLSDQAGSTPSSTCTGFADRLRADGFPAPAAKHFAQGLREDCMAAQ